MLNFKQYLGKSLSDFRQPSPDGRVRQLPSRLFYLRCPSSGTHRLFTGSSLGAKMRAFTRAHPSEYSLELLLPVSFPHCELHVTPASPRDPPWPTSSLAQATLESLLWAGSPVHVKTCVCPPRAESLFLPVLWRSCAQTLAFKAKCSGGSSFQYQTLRLRNLRQGSELSLLWENLSNRINFLSMGHPPGRFGILLSHKSAFPTFPMWFFICLWM